MEVGNVFTPRISWCFDEMPWLETQEGRGYGLHGLSGWTLGTRDSAEMVLS